MTSDFSTYRFQEGKTYAVEVDPAANAVRVSHHGEGQLEPQAQYSRLEYAGQIGSGPWRRFVDWEIEGEVTIDSHHIIRVEGLPDP